MIVGDHSPGHLGLDQLVDHLVLSCEVGVAKPDPAIYQDALDRLEVAPGDAVLVDDRARYCAGAVAVGMQALPVRRRPDQPEEPTAWPQSDDLATVSIERW